MSAQLLGDPRDEEGNDDGTTMERQHPSQTETVINFRMNIGRSQGENSRRPFDRTSTNNTAGNPPHPGSATTDDWIRYFNHQARVEQMRQHLTRAYGLEQDCFGLYHRVNSHDRFHVQFPPVWSFPQAPTLEHEPPKPSLIERMKLAIEIEQAYNDKIRQKKDKREGDDKTRKDQLVVDSDENDENETVATPSNSLVDDSETVIQSDNSLVLASGPIVSNDNPRFRELAEALDEFRADGVADDTAASQDHFTPSYMLKEEKGLVEPYTWCQGSRYLGDVTSRSFSAQKIGLPDHENCALWVTNLPANLEIEELFNVIRTGAIYAIHINEADEKHNRSAAKVVFMNCVSAAAFITQSETGGGFRLDGLRMRVKYNRVGYLDSLHPEKTRVLHIRGPAHLMSVDIWEKYFSSCVVYQLEATRQRKSRDQAHLIMEFRFARVDGQAEALYRAIAKEPKFKGVYEVTYGPDPCDPDSGYI